MTHLPSFTPFPNVLFDLMPALKDTEWRALCVIVRQTLGWQERAEPPKGMNNLSSPFRLQRKQTDWLSHQQLKARTHRSSAPICRAVDSLVRRGLLMVVDEQGAPLQTPQARRAHRGRLYFRLAASLLSEGVPTISLSRKQTSESEMTFSESEFHKVKTTKETHTKYTPNGGERDAARSPIEGKISLKRQPLPEPPNPDVKRFIHAYIETFKRHTPSGDPPPIFWGKDGKLVKQLLKVYAYDRLVDLLKQFFQSDDEWLRKLPCSLGAFKAAIPKLLVGEKQVAVIERRDEVTGQWVKIREERL